MTEYEIFKWAFPQLNLTEELFTELSKHEQSNVIRDEHGVAVTNGHNLVLIAVEPAFQRKGIGTSLLKKAEELIKADGHNDVYLCGSLLPGVEAESVDFFRKHGYEITGTSVEMELDLKGFSAPEASLPDGVTFGYFNGDNNRLIEAVREVDEEWVQYFGYNPTFCGFNNGKLASFCIVGFDDTCLLSDGINKIGSIGCVGTVPCERKQGIGLQMVALAAEELIAKGCDKCFIHYTHLENWYAKLGAKTFYRFYAGGKHI